jgi:hypothetical protein
MSNTNEMVAHLWANQSKPSARSGNGNFWFEGATIYSYRTPIAVLIKDDAGEVKGVLRTSRTYSVTTTGKHEHAISAALREGLPEIRVPYLTSQSADAHQVNIAHLEKDITDSFKAACRAVTNADWKFEATRRAVRNANAYRELFGLDIARFTLPENFGDEERKAADRAQRRLFPDPASADKRERERARRQQRKREAEEKVEREREERAREAVEAWRAGIGRSLADHWRIPVSLRVKPGDPNTLETSRGATVPLQDAVRIFRLAQRCRDKGEALPRETVASMSLGHRQVGDFRLDAIDADGTIHAGCHVIRYEESERLAASLGMLDPPPAAEAA